MKKNVLRNQEVVTEIAKQIDKELLFNEVFVVLKGVTHEADIEEAQKIMIKHYIKQLKSLL